MLGLLLPRAMPIPFILDYVCLFWKKLATELWIELSLRWSKYFYMTSVPQQNDLEWPRLEPSPQDFNDAMRLTGRVHLKDDTSKGKVFTVPDKFTLPKQLEVHRLQPQKSWPKCGNSCKPKSCCCNSVDLSKLAIKFSACTYAVDRPTGSQPRYLKKPKKHILDMFRQLLV